MRPVLGLRIVFGAAVMGSAYCALGLGVTGCQTESNASFDDSQVPPDADQTMGGGTKGGNGSGGSSANAGSSAQGGDVANGGGGANGGAGGKGMGGAGGKGMGGMGGKNMGGAGGMPEGGNMMGGSAGMSGGGNMMGGMAGMGGSGNPPEPVTIEITDIIDATIASCMVNTNFGSDKTLDVDGDAYCVYASLLQAALTDIPPGATVTKATLSLHCIDRGDALSVYYANAKWVESMVRWNNRPTVGAEVGSLACMADNTTVTLDLTAAVVAWLSGSQEQNGIYLTTKSTDGVTFDSTEADAMDDRPSLSVTYTPAQ